MKRNTPLKRTRMKRRKRPRYPSPAQLEQRRVWGEAFDRCWICQSPRQRYSSDPAYWYGLEVHEIGSRAKSPGRWADERNYFATCGRCHAAVLSWLPECVQMAFKKQFDPTNYDRSFINEIRGRADSAIEEFEVVHWERFIKAIRG